MKIIHVVPSAWNYFDDIRDVVFRQVEAERGLGLESEIYTIQYGGVNKRERLAAAGKAPSLNFGGLAAPEKALETFAEFDLVHVHCPFFGFARRILIWKKSNPQKPMVVTFHRAFEVSDLFSVLILFYNAFYQTKIFKASDAAVCFNEVDFRRLSRLTNSGNSVELMRQKPEVSAFEALYKKLLNS